MKATKKKICFIIPTFNPGGTENYLLRFLKFSDSKFNVTIICKNSIGCDGSLLHQYKELPISIICQPLSYFNLKNFKKIYVILKNGQFDTVCDLTGNFGGLPMLFSRMLKIKNRISFYRRSSYAFKQTKLNLFYNSIVNRLVYHNATKIFSNSTYALDFFFPHKKKDDKRFKVIPNGVNQYDFTIEGDTEELRNSLKIKNDIFLIGHIGRYDSAKNHETILKVAEKLIKTDDSIEFLFCGMDTNDDELKNKIQKYNLTDKVHTLGVRNDVPSILKLFDIFYFPSITEGQPNALIEAMISNIPIVTSNIEPIKEVMPIDKYNLLVAPNDIDNAVVSILNIKKDSKIRKKHQFRDWAIKSFNFETNFKKFEIEL